jgi:hypothetical protein
MRSKATTISESSNARYYIVAIFFMPFSFSRTPGLARIKMMLAISL